MRNTTDDEIFSADGSVHNYRIETKSSTSTTFTPSNPPDDGSTLNPKWLKFEELENMIVDIDGIFGPARITNLSKILKSCFTVNVTNNYIKNKTELVIVNSEIKKLKKLTNLQIGSVTIPAGVASIYYVTPVEYTDKNKEVLLNFLNLTIENAMKIMKKQPTTDSFIINYDELSQFSTELINCIKNKNAHKHDFLFIETFGNKSKMSVSHSGNTVSKLADLISKNFNTEHFPHVKVDLGLNLKSENDILFIESAFFESINIEPNYFLFFNKNFANYNAPTYQLKTNSLVKESDLFEKINLYSTIEDILGIARKYSCIPTVSMELSKSNILGHSPISSTNQIKKEYHQIAQPTVPFNGCFFKIMAIQN